jgi:hypothetical protein
MAGAMIPDMNSLLPLELEKTLRQLDPKSASLLERLVRDALALVRQKEPDRPPKTDKTNGWPAGYFERTVGAFANEPLDFPEDPPPAAKADW